MSVFDTLVAPGANGHTTRTQTIGCFWHTLAAYGGKRARLARFERATCGFEVRRSIQLSYRRASGTF